MQRSSSQVLARLALVIGLVSGSAASAQVVFTSGFESDVAVADVEWAANTRLVTGDAMDALQSADVETGMFVFDSAALGASGISFSTGDILLIEELALGRVESVVDDGGSVTVTTSAASLADAIESGRLFMDMDIGFEQIAQSKVQFGKGTCSPNIDGLTVTFECTFDDYTLNMAVTGGRDKSTVQFQVVKGIGDNATASFTGTGTISEFNQMADIRYSGGELESVDSGNNGLQLDINIKLAAAAAGSSDVKYTVPFPIFKIPFAVGPIPVTVDIGAQLLARLEVPASASASAEAEADFSYNGDTGLTYEGSSGNVMLSAQTNNVDFSNGSFDSASLFATVNAIFGMAVPRVSLNVFTAEVGYVLTGAVIRTTLYTGPICKEGEVQVLVQGGYGLSILGVDLLQESEVIISESRLAPEEGCPQSQG